MQRAPYPGDRECLSIPPLISTSRVKPLPSPGPHSRAVMPISGYGMLSVRFTRSTDRCGAPCAHPAPARVRQRSAAGSGRSGSGAPAPATSPTGPARAGRRTSADTCCAPAPKHARRPDSRLWATVVRAVNSNPDVSSARPSTCRPSRTDGNDGFEIGHRTALGSTCEATSKPPLSTESAEEP